jgi:hypothetical protein
VTTTWSGRRLCHRACLSGEHGACRNALGVDAGLRAASHSISVVPNKAILCPRCAPTPFRKEK